jgi:hypothetical protein
MFERRRFTDDGNKPPGCYLFSAFMAFWTILIVNNLWPGVIGMGTFELWSIKQGNWLTWLWIDLPIFIWGSGITLIVRIFNLNLFEEIECPEEFLVIGTSISLWAGIMEEICFRWIIFFGAIVSAKITNFLFFGWLGFGLTSWLQIHLFGPINNWVTLGYLSKQLADPANWAIGAGLLSANAFFRDGHKYQGYFGWVNSWFIGMFLFWVTFNYGLPAAILIHFVYDFLIFFTRYLDSVYKRRKGLLRAY